MTDAEQPERHSRLKTIRDASSDNLFLIIAACLSGFMLFGVPQVTNLIRPTLTWNQWTFWFLLLLAVLAFVYVTTLLRFIWPEIQFKSVFGPAQWINGWLIWIARKLSRLGRGVSGYVVPAVLFAIGMVLFFSVGIELNTPYVLFGGFVNSVGLWLILVAIWLLAGRILGADRMLAGKTLTRRMQLASSLTAEGDIQPRSAWQACGEVLSWLAAMGVILEVLWLTASYELPGASYRLFSIAALIHIAILWVVLAALADFLQKTTPLPARLLTFLLILAIVIHGSFSDIADAQPEESVAAAEKASEALASEPTSTPTDWLDTLEKRIESTPEGPVVMVAASGGGSRAALFTSLVLQMLATEPMTEFPEARQVEVSDRADQKTWGEHIVLISCVSGGSLASARYVWNDGYPADDHVPDLRYSVRDDLLDLTQDKLSRWACLAREKAKSKKSKTTSTSEIVDVKLLEQEQKRFKEVADQIGRLRENGDWKTLGDDAQTTTVIAAFSSRMADDMSMDFMAPILRGFLTPFSTRGEGLYHFWRHRFGWERVYQPGPHLAPVVDDPSGSADQAPPPRRPSPLVMFNTSDADGGRRVIVGFPNLTRGSLVGSPHAETPSAGRADEYSPLPLCDFANDPVPELALARAVRLSSNFPFGFGVSMLSESSLPKLTIHSEAPPIRGQSQRKALRLLDGGVVDNTGIDSLHAVIKSLEASAAAKPRGRESRVLDLLRQRGVVFLEIDSGAKPSGSRSGPFASATRPLSALNNAVYTNALRTSDQQQTDLERCLSDSIESRMLATIQQDPETLVAGPLEFKFTKEELVAAATAVFQPRQFAQQPLSVIRYRFMCNHLRDTRSDVMTALALGPDDKSTVIAMYLSEVFRWRQELDAIRDKYRENIGYRGLNAYTNEDVAGLTGRLLRRAKAELQQADLRGRLLRESWDQTGELEDSEKILRLSETLVRPVTLLLAVKEIARSSSMVIEGKDEQFAKLTEIVDGILADDESGIANLVASERSLPQSIDITKLDAAQFIPDESAMVYSKLNEAIEQADRTETPKLWQQQLQFDQQRDQMMQFEQLKQDRLRVRAEFFNAIGD
ncbi:Patatin-like phospholipase [Stieleria maiorica]|uniref:Patatin-like phospholipase n=1 Tax=Stieleria maiorica TaxID=2795974 RepID=A0A5B9M8D7_9BACT|nr:patatin-like phospholipase family protein [Stieleria maiorica]QEF97458.1 Patatin-like phospholipase [Stieleria maiorica]